LWHSRQRSSYRICSLDLSGGGILCVLCEFSATSAVNICKKSF
jgi:hypothetical protein